MTNAITTTTITETEYNDVGQPVKVTVTETQVFN